MGGADGRTISIYTLYWYDLRYGSGHKTCENVMNDLFITCAALFAGGIAGHALDWIIWNKILDRLL